MGFFLFFLNFLKSPRNGIWEQNLVIFDFAILNFQNNYFQSRITDFDEKRQACQTAQDQHGSHFLACETVSEPSKQYFLDQNYNFRNFEKLKQNLSDFDEIVSTCY